MITRRRFVQLSASALPVLATPSIFAQRHVPLGLQLFTVRDEIEKDLPAALKQVRAIGYEEVELNSDTNKHPAKELRTMIADAGLRAPSVHFSYEEFAGRFNYAKEVGVDWMVLSTLPEHLESSPDGFRRGAQKLNEWGKRAQAMGMRVAFHTHAHEFHQFQNVTGFDVLRQETDPNLVAFEIDCYWATQAGKDPVLILNQLGKRVRMLHLKDRKAGFPTSTDGGPQHFTEVGTGTINWREILALAQKLQVEHYFVEQDETTLPEMESARISYNYLRKILP